jgi:1-deoxyxylulose-5-phosphate synthase
MAHFSRRDFLRAGLAATTLAGTGKLWAAKRSATDFVTLGNSGVKVTRLAFGTGTFSGRVQRELGQEGFTRLVRYAYDQGIRFFETAEAYRGMPEMLGIALKGLPRDSYRLMTKYSGRSAQSPQEKIDGFRRALNTEYIDILLLHYMRGATWVQDTKPVQDAFSEAKSKKIITAHGASVHGLQALGAIPGQKWLDVALMRVNHKGVRMDNDDAADTDRLGDVNQVAAQAKKIHAQGTGVLGMKLIGEGAFTDAADREASMKFVMGLGTVDAVTIGYKSTAEIDEAMERMNRALNA